MIEALYRSLVADKNAGADAKLTGSNGVKANVTPDGKLEVNASVTVGAVSAAVNKINHIAADTAVIAGASWASNYAQITNEKESRVNYRLSTGIKHKVTISYSRDAPANMAMGEVTFIDKSGAAATTGDGKTDINGGDYMRIIFYNTDTSDVSIRRFTERRF